MSVRNFVCELIYKSQGTRSLACHEGRAHPSLSGILIAVQISGFNTSRTNMMAL